jgi:hypothetical protein
MGTRQTLESTLAPTARWHIHDRRAHSPVRCQLNVLERTLPAEKAMFHSAKSPSGHGEQEPGHGRTSKHQASCVPGYEPPNEQSKCHGPAYARGVNEERHRASGHRAGCRGGVRPALHGDREPQSRQRNRRGGPEETGEALGFEQIALERGNSDNNTADQKSK